MNEEAFYTFTDQLILEASEDHRAFITRLKACDGDALADELQMELARRDSGEAVNWARVFILAVYGEMNDLTQ